MYMIYIKQNSDMIICRERRNNLKKISEEAAERTSHKQTTKCFA